MKKIILIILLGICFTLSGEAQLEDNILSQQDIDMQMEGYSWGPALSSSPEDPNAWEAYNEWRCFATEEIHLSCSIYDVSTEVAGMQIYSEGMNYFYDLPVESNLNCYETLLTWRDLIGKSLQVCIFAAQLPGAIAESGSLWYIQKIKTEYGYWNLFPTDLD